MKAHSFDVRRNQMADLLKEQEYGDLLDLCRTGEVRRVPLGPQNSTLMDLTQ